MIRVVLPAHLRTLARVNDEVQIDVAGEATLRSVLDALESSYPMLQGTIRDHSTLLAARFVLGPLAALGLGWMIHRTLQIPQTMAATGLFYIAILFVMVGEILGRLILFRTSLPL